jgi:hypothetical protein
VIEVGGGFVGLLPDDWMYACPLSLIKISQRMEIACRVALHSIAEVDMLILGVVAEMSQSSRELRTLKE